MCVLRTQSLFRSQSQRLFLRPFEKECRIPFETEYRGQWAFLF
jgi:hypothetical protein